jgi:ATP/ADP translocase/HEAT repeat protein
MTGVLGVRREDRRTVGIAFATLFAIVASHAVLETARDALFLADLPVRTLPWAYLCIAGLAFVVSYAGGRFFAGRSPRRVLALTLLAGAAGTALFWWVLATPARGSLLALYVWTGLLASLVVTQFWVQLASRVDVAQAKRAYAVIAAGGMLGATVGSIVAGVVVRYATSRALLPVAAVSFALAACFPALTSDGPAVEAPVEPAAEPASEDRPDLSAVWRDTYLKRLLLLAVLGPIVTMGIDYVFKSIVSHEVPKAELGSFFAHFNAVVNGAALAVQLTIAPRLLQSLGVVRILCVLPAALGLVAAGVAGTLALPAALVLRGIDGTLRHSLHRAATEILFLPLPASMRTALRGFAESIGLRGGQLLGSLGILGAIVVGATPREIAIGVAVVCGVWLVGYLRLQDHYVDRFRTQLRHGAPTDAEIPDLDVRSIEALVASLSSSNDAEVIAALDLLATYDRVRLVPPLILYHPSPAVVLRALEIFDGVDRDDVRDLRRRLLDHADEQVRAAALRRLASGGQDRDQERDLGRDRARELVRTALRRDTSPLVRRTALVLWLGFDERRGPDFDAAVADLVALDDPASRLAVASALGELPSRVLLPVARALLAGATPDLRRQVARSLATDPDASRIPLLIELVAVPECRVFARGGLVALGAPALDALARALERAETPRAVRRHLPRTISRFGTGEAAAILVAQLARETDARVAHKALRGLGRLRADHPTIPVDHATLVTVAERTLERMIELLAYRVAHELRRGEPAGSAPPDVDLLGRLLGEMEHRALEQVFRVLQVLETREDFATIFQALTGETPATRAAARELIGHVLEGRFRDALLALTDSLPPAERLRAAASAVSLPVAERVLAAATARTAPDAASFDDPLAVVLQGLRADRSVTLSSLARHELGAATAPPPIRTLEVRRAAG